LLSSWDGIRHGYHTGDKDETVRGCARRLDTTVPGPEGDPVLFWTLGLLTLAPYVVFGNPGPGVEDKVVAVLSRVARGDDDRACAHGWHPYEADGEDALVLLPAGLEVLSSPVSQALGDLLSGDLLPEGTTWRRLRARRPNPRTSPGPRSSPAGRATPPGVEPAAVVVEHRPRQLAGLPAVPNRKSGYRNPSVTAVDRFG
jgi:hypothetical protein